MELRKPFQPLQIYMEQPNGEAALRPMAPVALPPNAPQQVLDAVWTQIANQTLQNAVNERAIEVEYSIVNAVVESVRVASEFRTSGKLIAYRNVKFEVQLSARWIREPVGV